MNCSKTGVLRAGWVGLLASVLLVLSAPASFAAPIEGSILITGGLFTDTNDLENATEILFDSGTVLHTTGDFAADGVTGGDAVTFDTNPLSLSPALPLDFWSVGSFSFKLMTLTIETQTDTTLAISGTGKIGSSTPGLDPVPGFWRLTTQTFGMGQGENAAPGVLFSFSSSAVAVPEPSSISLIALGLAGLGMRRRRQ